MVKTWDVVHPAKTWPAGLGANTWTSTHTCANVASVDLGDQCRPTATRMVLHISMWPSDHEGTTRWLICHNFSEMVLADRLEPERDHQQQVMCAKSLTWNLKCTIFNA